MPNWCSCTMTVAGEPTAINHFLQVAQAEVEYESGTAMRSLSLEALYPAPDLVRENGSWNGWCETHWGTKWDVRVIADDFFDDCTIFEFDSAWQPPIEALIHISADHPDLAFELNYREPSMKVSGSVEMRGGVLL